MIQLEVDPLSDYPRWTSYSFQLLDGQNNSMWRYDNAPYHPEVASFPHHLHDGTQNKIVESPQPTVEILVERLTATLEADS